MAVFFVGDEPQVCYPVVGSDVVYVVYFEGVVYGDAVDAKSCGIERPVYGDVDAFSLMRCSGVAVAVPEVCGDGVSFGVEDFSVDEVELPFSGGVFGEGDEVAGVVADSGHADASISSRYWRRRMSISYARSSGRRIFA